MKVYEIYPKTNSRIETADLKDFAEPVTIDGIEVTGDKKKTVWVSFKGTSLKFKCSRKDVFNLAKELNTNDTDEFNGKKVLVSEENEKLVIHSVVEDEKTVKK